jgi:two-component system alkaline phosphatase synthesis response regulator PhoP
MVANNTDEGFKKLFESPPDLILLDVWLPSIGGLEFCRQIRQDPRGRHVPVLMLTVQDKESDKVMGLEMGADDYMTKPFSQRELLARIKALLRRFERAAPEVLNFTSGDLTADLDKEFDLLIVLFRGRNKAVSRQNLLTAVWGFETPGNTGTIDVHIRHLRKKLGAHGDKIKTILGFGYRFDG